MTISPLLRCCISLALISLACVSSLNVTIVVQINTYGKVIEANTVGRSCSQADILSGTCRGGLARKTTLFQQIVNETNGNVVFIDMGNILAVDGIYRFYRGSLQAEAMRPFKFAAMVPRNLDWSIDRNEPNNFETQSGIPVVSANIISLSTDKRAYHPFSLQVLPNGVKVAVVGSNYATAVIAGQAFASNFTTHNRIGFTGEAIGEAKSAGADIVIVADNSGNLGPQCSRNDEDCFPEAPYLDIHIVNQKVNYPNGTVFSCEDDCSFGRSVLRIDAALRPDRSISRLVSATVPVELSIPPDPYLSHYLRNAIDYYRKATAGDVIGFSEFTTTFAMLKSDTEHYSHSTGDIVADSIMFKSQQLGFKPDVVIINKGTIRDVFPAGNITRDQAQLVVPFADTICIFTISGGYLLQALQAATRLQIDNAFPEVSGMRFWWAPQIADGDKYGTITRILIGNETRWEPLSIEQTYVVATNGFVRSGGDEYTLFRDNGYDFRDGLASVVQAIIDFISSKKVIRQSDYAERRGIIDSGPYIQRLTGKCRSGSYLKQDGTCNVCPLSVDGSSDLWVYKLLPSEDKRTISSIIIINNGPIAVLWSATISDHDQFTLSPSFGEIPKYSNAFLNVTRKAAIASVISFHVDIKISDPTIERICYKPLSFDVPVDLLSVVYRYSSILFYIVSACFILVSISIAIIAAVVYFYRHSPMIRAASPILLLVNLLGALILSSSSLTFVASLDNKYGDAICELRWWSTCLGFITMFSPLYMKIYRIDQIFVSRSMRVVYIPNATLLRGIGLMAAAMAAFLTVHTIAFPSIHEVVPAPTLDAPSPDTQYTISQCTTHEANLAIVLTACGLLTIWGARIAWHSRNVPSDFNESSSIAVSLVFVVLYCLLVLPLQFLLRSSPDIQVILRGVGVNIGVAVSLAAFYLGKLDLIYRGRANRIPSIGSVRHPSPHAQSMQFTDFEVASP